MQKFCIWETGYKIPKIDYIKLQSQSNCNKQHWEGKGKHKKGKETVFALSVPTTAVFLSGTVGLSLEWLWEVKKEKERKEKKKQDFYM